MAAALAARPMSLYSFIETKDDLIERMLDAVRGELLLDVVPDDGRDALLAIARRTVEVGARHPWIIAASAQSSVAGPNAQAHARQTFEALSGLGADDADADARSLAMAIDIYLIGFAAVSLGNPEASADDRVITDGLNWLLDGFERRRESHAHNADAASGT